MPMQRSCYAAFENILQRFLFIFFFFFIYYLFGKRQRKLSEHENVDIRFAIIIDLRLSDMRLRFSVNLYYERVITRIYTIYNVSLNDFILLRFILYAILVTKDCIWKAHDTMSRNALIDYANLRLTPANDCGI